MNLLADEGIDKPIVDRLRQEGHAFVYIAEAAPSMPDEAILAMANAQQAVLVTHDKDFGELVYRMNQLTKGVILVRLDGLQPETKAEVSVSDKSSKTNPHNIVTHQPVTNSVIVLPILATHIFALDGLPVSHKAPFDRLLVAQANSEGATLVSADAIFKSYSVHTAW